MTDPLRPGEPVSSPPADEGDGRPDAPPQQTDRGECRGPPGDDPVDAAWGRVQARWDDPQVHDRFVELCLQLGRLPEAGRRYRIVRDTDPERGEDARRRIERLLTLATHTLELGRAPPPDTNRAKRRISFFAVGLCLFMLLYTLWAWLGEPPVR